MEDYLSDTSKKVFVYEDRGKKTGLMVLKISEDAAEIIGIAVSDNARRKGIGTQLIQRVMESEDLKSVKAQTDDDSIGFYRKCGFSDERIVIEYPDGAAVRYNCVLHKIDKFRFAGMSLNRDLARRKRKPWKKWVRLFYFAL